MQLFTLKGVDRFIDYQLYFMNNSAIYHFDVVIGTHLYGNQHILS